MARKLKDVWFVGRLATYGYYKMDQVVGQALATFKQIQADVPLADTGAGFVSDGPIRKIRMNGTNMVSAS